ncbi:MAG: cytochrome c biogenesis protein ResB [Bdellovibrionales bacterium]
MRKIAKALASIKIAVVVIVGMGILTAAGTITEARYNDAEMAQQLVYKSPFMYVVFGLLCVNLIAVMVDRWPWKKHHTGFVTAHIGILILLLGSWITKEYGIDGSMAFGMGESSRSITVPERNLTVYASTDGMSFTPIAERETDFIRNPPTAENPIELPVGSDRLKIVEYHHFAFKDVKISASEEKNEGPAVRFQLENPRVSVTEWLRRDATKAETQMNLGPARVVLARKIGPPSGQNEIILAYDEKSEKLLYAIYGKDGKTVAKGETHESDTLDTTWMGLKFRIFRFYPHAKEEISFIPTGRSTPAATSALRFELNGASYWLGLNSVQRIFLNDKVYFVSFGNRRIDLNFPIYLKKFTIGTYQGTDQPSSYESLVFVQGLGDVLISMNEPLKHDGFTFYQSSFERDETGKPVVSILSVNHDPGRWLKYLGSMLIVAGAVILFWFKRAKIFTSARKGVAS